jgi:hypothetical protein
MAAPATVENVKISAAASAKNKNAFLMFITLSFQTKLVFMNKACIINSLMIY